MILGFDPGRDKCGVAVMSFEREIIEHQVVNSQEAIAIIDHLAQKFSLQLLVMGNQTTAKSWQAKITAEFPELPIIMIDERNSSLEARDRYWLMYPPQGLTRVIPQGMRLPSRPIDDIVAILLIERYLRQNSL